MNRKQLYESIMSNVSKEVIKAINEAEANELLEQYGLSYIFALNEDSSKFSQMINALKKPFANVFNKINQKFGKQSATFIADIVKSAQSQSKIALIAVLTVIASLGSTQIAQGAITPDFRKEFAKTYFAADIAKETHDSLFKDVPVESQPGLQLTTNQIQEFENIVDGLRDDDRYRYGGSGVGVADNEQKSLENAKENTLNTMKKKFGENCVQEYGIKFKVLQIKKWKITDINGEVKLVYVTIVVAYQNLHPQK